MEQNNECSDTELAALRQRSDVMRELAEQHKALRELAEELQKRLTGVRNEMKELAQRMEAYAIEPVQLSFLGQNGDT